MTELVISLEATKAAHSFTQQTPGRRTRDAPFRGMHRKDSKVSDDFTMLPFDGGIIIQPVNEVVNHVLMSSLNLVALGRSDRGQKCCGM